MESRIKELWTFMGMLCASVSANAYDFEIDGVYYDITSFTELTVAASSLNSEFVGDLIIPSTVTFNGKTLNVTKIESQFAKGHEKITSLYIPVGITSIGEAAFAECKFLESVSLNGVSEISDSAFAYCSCLKSVMLNEGLTSIGTCAFAYDENIETIDIPASVACLGGGLFKGCVSLKNVQLPPVDSISSESFSGCEELSKLELPSTLKYIGSKAFCNTAFEEFVIPNSVIDLGDEILAFCFNLKTLTIGSGITNLKSNPVRGCSSIENMIFADSKKDLIISFRGDIKESYRWHKHSPIETTHDWVNVDFRKSGLCSIPFKKAYIGRNIISSTELYSSSDGGYNENNYTLPPFCYHPSVETITVGDLVTKLSAVSFNLDLDGYIAFKYNNIFGYFQGCINLNNLSGNPSISEIGPKFISNSNIIDNEYPLFSPIMFKRQTIYK